MTELANWVAGPPTPMPANYNALDRLRHEPLRPAARPARGDLRRAPGAPGRRLELRHRHRCQLLGGERRHRNLGLDPEPANQNMLVGDQAHRGPHQPLRHHSDHRRPGHAGPDGADSRPTPPSCSACSRSAAPDPNDPRQGVSRRRPDRDYTRFLERDALKGARIGMPRAFYYDRITPPGVQRAARRPEPGAGEGRCPKRSRCSSSRARSSSIRPTSRASSTGSGRNFLRWPICRGADGRKGNDADCSVVFKYGMKRDFNKWLRRSATRAR